ncbi:Uncharacterised protein [Mycoplasmopsis citelli]|uniref:Lipoprotein n=1 Tax=Mycoplasmopsis citelli TaxID=171281 RepID=A0A449B176_9BACT|nr:hypothetical protein [Mycoplasmopsis citelli]VEU74357.1 Uncharacterised protein [Mycoplasmopsis citelli]
MKKRWIFAPILLSGSLISTQCSSAKAQTTNETNQGETNQGETNQGETNQGETNTNASTNVDFNKEINSTLDFEKFNNEIIDSANNEYPSVFISRNASQFFISSFIAMVAQLQLISKIEKQKPHNDVIYLIDSSVNSYEKTSKKEMQRFNFAHLLDKYGDVTLTDQNNNYNVDKGKLLALDNPNYLNLSGYQNYSVYPRNLTELQGYLKPYLDKQVKLFDFYIPDISFTALNSQVRNFILEHANKIVILSDGNAQPYSFINDDYIKWVKNQKTHFSQEELLKAWDSLKTSNPQKIDFHYFYTLEDKFKIYNLNGKYAKSFNDQLEKEGFEWAKINIYDYPLNYLNITKNLPQLNEQEFLSDYNKLVNLDNKKLEDLIVAGKQNFNKSKKNIVFTGSSLFRQDKGGPWRIKSDTLSRKELHAYFNKILDLYPPDQYNYLYKLHPVYKGNQALEYIKEFTNGHEKEAIILDPSISWENMLALDMQALENNESVLFDRDDFTSGQVKTKLFGIQPTSTVLLATIVMLQAQFKITLEQALVFVDPKNFPISDTFNIVKRDFHYTGNDGQEANRKELYKVYKHFIETGLFPSIELFPAMSEFLK